MSERKALLRHVIAHPDDDAPRLVMADWLDENGDPERAEFIRLQVALAADEAAASDDPVPFLSSVKVYRTPADEAGRARMDRIRALYDAHRREWTADVARWARDDADFRRGFIDKVRCTAAAYLKGAGGLHKSAPLTELNLTQTAGHVAALAACPHLALVARLSLLTNGLDGADAAALAASPHLGGLRELRLSSAVSRHLAGDAGPVLRACRPGLVSLELTGYSISDADAASLAGDPAAACLRGLNLNGGNVGPAGAGALATSDHLAGLAALVLSGNPVGDHGALELVRSGRLAGLCKLHLWNCGLTPAGVATLAAEPGLARLRSLELSANPVGDDGVAFLAASPHAAGLRQLYLRGCRIGPAGAAALASSPFLGGVEGLHLGGNPFGPECDGPLAARFGPRVSVYRPGGG